MKRLKEAIDRAVMGTIPKGSTVKITGDVPGKGLVGKVQTLSDSGPFGVVIFSDGSRRMFYLGDLTITK